MSVHNDLYERAIEAIQELFADTSVSQLETSESLKGLYREIDINLRALGEDLMYDMIKRGDRFKEAAKAIEGVFLDPTVSSSRVIESLKNLREEIDKNIRFIRATGAVEE